MLTVKKILAGRGAVDYYLNQTRRGLADSYLPDERAHERDGAARLSAPGSSWWGGGAEAPELRVRWSGRRSCRCTPRGSARVGAVSVDGSGCPRRLRRPTLAPCASPRRSPTPTSGGWAKHEIRRRGGHASVAAWDCISFSPPRSVSLLWAAGDNQVQRQVWAAHLAAVDAGLAYLEEHAGYVRAGRNGVRVLDTSGWVVARMNEWTSRDGDMHLHTHCLVLNRAQTVVDGRWRALDGRALLSARTSAGALYNRTLEAELTTGRPRGEQLLPRLADSGRATLTRRDLLRAALDVLPPGRLPRAQLQVLAEGSWAGRSVIRHWWV